DLQSFLDYLTDRAGGVLSIQAIDIGLLRGYVAYLHECQYAKTTMARRLACLRTLFRFAVREGLTDANPARALRTPRLGRRLPHSRSTEQVAQLLEAPPANTPMGLRDRAMLETLYSAGLRVAELVSLNVEDWDRDAGVVRVKGKGRKERVALIGRYAAKALAR